VKVLKEELTKVWESLETKQLAKIFEEYMKSIGVRKYDGRRKNNSNTYMIDASSTNWNRVQCYYYKDSTKYEDRNLLIVLRKRAGNYFIVEKERERAFEVDYSGIRHYDEVLLNEIIEEYKPLFNSLLSVINY
jgi:hypothetical protein